MYQRQNTARIPQKLLDMEILTEIVEAHREVMKQEQKKLKFIVSI